MNSQWPGQALSLQVDSVLFDQRSEYQHVLVFESVTWGKVLILDGVIQLTERDEMAYQEMIAHLPLFSHPNPEHVLIIGGGDGGVIREVVKHEQVKSITICEIDRVVIDAGKRFFPSVAAAWDDPRLTLHEGDGAVFMQRPDQQRRYDVIICDSSDPIGPAQSLFESPFYSAMHAALRPGGRVCTQAESLWMHLPLIQRLLTDSIAIFANAEYATTQIPTYPAGQIGFLLCCKEKEGRGAGGGRLPSCATPVRKIPKADQIKFRFYTSALHSAAFVLPAFVQRVVDAARREALEAKEGKVKAKRDSKGGGSAEAAADAVEADGNSKRQKVDS